VIDRYGAPSRPDDIPEAVWHSCWWAQAHGLQEVASRQIMAAKAEEREACSNLLLAAAEKKQALRLALGEMTSQEMRTLIAGIGFLAATIRKRGEAD
jgi:hypothetical protein